MLVLLLALVRADVVTVEIPEALIDGDIPANAAAYCRQHGLGPTPRGVACADAVLLDAGASLGRRSLARAARGDADGAVEDARRRTEIARQDAAAWRQYGLALLDRNHEGDARDAAAALEVAVAGRPDRPGRGALARARASLNEAARGAAGRDLRVRRNAGCGACSRRRGTTAWTSRSARTARDCVEISSSALQFVEVGATWIRSSVSEERRVRVWAEKSDSLVDFHTGTWSNGLKLELLRDFCASLDEDTLVVAVDGYDVVVTGGRGRIVSRIKQLLERHPGRVVASADQTFYFRGPDGRASAPTTPPARSPTGS